MKKNYRFLLLIFLTQLFTTTLMAQGTREYYTNKAISGQTEDSQGPNYLLLHKIYTSTLLADHYVLGKITAIRGGTTGWNRKWTVEVNTSSAYSSNRGSIISYNEPAALVTLTYNGESYLAVSIASNSALFSFSFTGYAQNETFTIVPDNSVTAVQIFTGLDPIIIQGNAGIGTTTPLGGTTNSGLHVGRGDHSTIMLGAPFSGYGGFIQTSDNKHRVFIGTNMYDDATSSWKTVQSGKGVAGISIIADEGAWGTKIDFITNTADTYNANMTILGNGNVGIGTTNPKSKLAVNGEIFAKRVKVTLAQADWPDYVFAPEYTLPSLADVEKYVKSNRHLADIPSAAEVEKEGVDLGEMNKKLLQKVEELTLYLIDQQKQIDQLRQQNEIHSKEP